MTRRAPPLTAGIIRAELGRRSAWLFGPGVKHAADTLGIPSMFCPTRRTWTVPVDHLGDLLAYLEGVDRRHVVVVEADP